MEPVIKVENLTKKYVISHQVKPGESALREVFSQKAKRLLTGKISGSKSKHEEFLALNNVSFEINKGERVGIIGRNGAGKSTLLKILSQITEPTAGRITMEGRVSSLLEVGTGFHPELTGRENIFLNGAILGMGKREIQSKFDEIVAFAEIEQFLDTPVKRYSSGMYVRLAFSIAAHLDPEILIIDEVLAVGDSVFQKKCLDRMNAIGREGKTILYVSHNLATVEALCTKAILLNKGMLAAQGGITEVANIYNDRGVIMKQEIDLSTIERTERNKQDVIFQKLVFNKLPIPAGEKIVFDIHLHSNIKRKFSDIDFGVNIMDGRSNCIVHCTNRFISKNFEHSDDKDSYRFSIENNLKPGHYTLVLFLRAEDVIQDLLSSQVGFEVADGNPYGFNDVSQIQGVTMPLFSIDKIV